MPWLAQLVGRVGTGQMKALLCRLHPEGLIRFISVGSVPLIELYWSHRYIICVSEPISDGIVPLIKLLASSRLVICVSEKISDGIVPRWSCFGATDGQLRERANLRWHRTADRVAVEVQIGHLHQAISDGIVPLISLAGSDRSSA